MKICFSETAWEQYLQWQKDDKKIIRRIHLLIKDIQATPFEGIGKPEALKHELSGFWSRRITQQHRLVYRYHEEEGIEIAQCRYHY